MNPSFTLRIPYPCRRARRTPPQPGALRFAGLNRIESINNNAIRCDWWRPFGSHPCLSTILSNRLLVKRQRPTLLKSFRTPRWLNISKSWENLIETHFRRCNNLHDILGFQKLFVCRRDTPPVEVFQAPRALIESTLIETHFRSQPTEKT